MAQQQTARYPFDVQSNGSTHVITYQQAKYPISMLFYTLIRTTVLLGMLIALGGFVFWVWFVVAVIIPTAIYLTINFLRRDGSFTITDEAIILNGKEYPRKHISSFFIQDNAKYSQPMAIEYVGGPPNVLVIGGDGSEQMAMSMATGIGTGLAMGVNTAQWVLGTAKNRKRRHKYDNNFKIGFSFGNKNIILASGLTAKSTDMLYNKVISILKNNISQSII